MTASIWCDFCQDHYDVGHYDEAGNHRAGAAYGPTGRQIEERARMIAALTYAREIIYREFSGDPEEPWAFIDELLAEIGTEE